MKNNEKEKPFIQFQTPGGNRYIYDRNHSSTLLSHPILSFFLNLEKTGTSIHQWIAELGDNPVSIDPIGSVPTSGILYYYNKYLFLKEAGLLSHQSPGYRLTRPFTAKDIHSSLANTRQVTLEVTDNCNLNCEYCGYGKFYRSYDKRDNKNLPVETAQHLLSFLFNYWNSPGNTSFQRNIFISFYGGEPLLNMPFIKEITRFIEESDTSRSRFSFSMTTNALLLEKYMDFLVEHDFHLLISLDGNENNNAYRITKNSEPAYPLILKNIEALRNRFPDYFQKKVNFNAVLHNKNSVSDIHRYFKENFDKSPSIAELNTTNIDEIQKDEFWKTYSNLQESLYQAEDYSLIEKEMFLKLPTLQTLGIFLHRFSGWVHNTYKDLHASTAVKPERHPTGTCVPFSRKIFLTVNGKILPCERINQKFGLGTIDENGVHLDLEEIAQRYNRYFEKMIRLCSNCYNIEACSQCIFNLDIDENHPTCNGFMTEKDFAAFFSSCVSYLETHPRFYHQMMNEVVID